MLSRALRWRDVAATLVLLDALVVAAVFTLVYLGRYRLEILPHRPQPTPLVIVLGVATWLLTLWSQRLYSSRQVGSGLSEYSRILVAGTWSLAAMLLILFVLYFTISRTFVLIAWAASTALVMIERFAARRMLRLLCQRGYRLRRVLVVGASAQGASIAQELLNNPAASAHVLGFLDDYKPAGTSIGDLMVLGEAASLGSIANRFRATHAVVVTAALSWESWRSIMADIGNNRLELLLAPGTFEPHANALEMTQLGGAVLLHPHVSRIIGAEAALKRLSDLGMASMALVTLPFLYALLVIKGSARPWTIRQAIYGQGGRVVDVPAFTDPALKRWHLSRLPAAWLVFLGHLSIIGPQPIAVGADKDLPPGHSLLLSMKPGLLGPWRLVGFRSDVSQLDRNTADLAYARSYTVWLDFQIIVAACLRPLFRRRLLPQLGSNSGARAARPEGKRRSGPVDSHHRAYDAPTQKGG